MARLFISHSSRDNAAALALRDWLASEGWDDIFLDLDPERGIVSGERWERALHQAAERCEAVLFLISQNWLSSDWCDREFDLAHRLGKRLFGVVLDDTRVDDIPARYTQTWQLTSLSGGRDGQLFATHVPPDGLEAHVVFSHDGLRRLRAGLHRAGLDPRYFEWPPAREPTRPPYRGLRPLEAEDAGIFFGRDAALVGALDHLRRLQERAAPRLLVILGASGAGKSSFLRAGLLPRLARDDRHFLALRPIRPEQDVLDGEHGLVAALYEAFWRFGHPRARPEIAAAARTGEGLVPLLAALAAAAQPPTLPGAPQTLAPAAVLSVDQAEELFLTEGAAHARLFLEALAEAARSDSVRVMVLFTIRTDFYGALQSAPTLAGLRQVLFSLPPMPIAAYREVIEGPPRRLEGGRLLRVPPQLTESLATEAARGGGDALPLLAFTLERLWNDYSATGVLAPDGYDAALGFAEAINAAVERALATAVRAGVAPLDEGARLALLRRGLIPWLAGIDPATKAPRRRRARIAEIPPEARGLMEHLVQARLLTTDMDGAEAVIEPAHEALLRRWGVLRGWLEEDLTLLVVLEGVLEATRDWEANDHETSWLAHRGGRLVDGEALRGRNDLWAKLGVSGSEYLTTCRRQEDAQRDSDLRAAFRYDLSLSDALFEKAQRHLREHRDLEGNCLLAAAYLQNPIVADRTAFLKLADATDATRSRRLAQTQLSGLIDLDRRIPIEHVCVADGKNARSATLTFDIVKSQLLLANESGLQRWDITTRKWLEPVICACKPVGVFLPTREAATLEDGALVVRDLDTGKEKQRAQTVVDTATTYIGDIVFSHDGRYVAINAKAVHVLNRATGTVTEFKDKQRYFNAYAIAPVQLDAGPYFAIGMAGEIGVYDCAQGLYVGKLAVGQRLSLDAVLYDAATNRYFAGGTEQKIYALRQGDKPVVIGEHNDTISSLTALPGERRFISTAWDGLAYLWRATDCKIEIAIPTNTNMDDPSLGASASSEDGKHFAILEKSGRINIWRRRADSQDARLANDNLILCLAPDPTNPMRIAAAGFVGPVAAIWTKGADGWERRVLQLIEPMRHVSFSRDGTVMAFCGDTAEISFFDARGNLLRTLRVAGDFAVRDKYNPKDRSDKVTAVALSSDGAKAAWIAPGGAVQIADVYSGAIRVIVPSGTKDFARLIFAPSGDALYASTLSGQLIAIDLNGKQRIVCSAIPQASTYGKGPAIGLSSDGQKLAVAGEDNVIRIFDAAGGQPELVLDGHREKFKRGWTESLGGLAFSPDRRLLVSSGTRQSGGSDPRTVRLWDIGTGDQIWRRIVNADCLAADFSADGQRLFLATGSEIHVVELGEIGLGLSAAERLERAETMLGRKWIDLL